MNEYQVILQALDLLISENLFPEKKPSDVLNLLMYVHTKGWLYTPMIDGVVKVVICAYRIPDATDESLKNMPKEESGNILYVPFVISLGDSNIYEVIRESLKLYLDANPNIEELVLEDKNNQIKRYKLKGDINGKE